LGLSCKTLFKYLVLRVLSSETIEALQVQLSAATGYDWLVLFLVPNFAAQNAEWFWIFVGHFFFFIENTNIVYKLPLFEPFFILPVSFSLSLAFQTVVGGRCWYISLLDRQKALTAMILAWLYATFTIHLLIAIYIREKLHILKHFSFD
jgi:hypothetical protein